MSDTTKATSFDGAEIEAELLQDAMRFHEAALELARAVLDSQISNDILRTRQKGISAIARNIPKK